MSAKSPTLVKETSTTTGNGATFALAGAAVGHRTFAAAGIDTSGGDVFPYCIRMGSDFEYGIGTINPAGTLNRTTIIESSNGGIGGSRVNFGAGTKDVYIAFAGANKAPGYYFFNQTDEPYTGKSTADGHSPGSMYVQKETYASGENYIAYLCVDNPSGTTTKYVALGMSGFGPLFEPTFTDPAKFGVGLGIFDDVVESKETVGVVAIGEAGKGKWPNSLLQGAGWTGGDYGSAQVVRGCGSKDTTDNTPTTIDIGGQSGSKLTLEANSTTLVKGTLVARDNTAPDSAAYSFEVLVERIGTGNPTILAGNTPTVIHETGGAAAWDFTLSIDNTNDSLEFNITGDATNPVRWVLEFTATQSAFT